MTGKGMHVAILSASYSGSTIINLVLGGLPDCYGIGESHWISDVPLDRFFCNTCSGDCRILSRSVRERMCSSKASWYDLALKASGCSVLISSEKDPNYYIQRQNPDKALILWKDPRAWLFSAEKNDNNPPEVSLASWANLYKRIINYVRENGMDAKILKLETFSSKPDSYLPLICEWIGVEYKASALETRQGQHYVGGNSMAQGIGRDESHKKTFGNSIRPDYRWEQGLSDELKELAANHSGVNDVAGSLAALENSGKYALG